jgi:hypothetical protein
VVENSKVSFGFQYSLIFRPIMKANEVVSFEPPEFSKFNFKHRNTVPASQDLFSRLDDDVAVSNLGHFQNIVPKKNKRIWLI